MLAVRTDKTLETLAFWTLKIVGAFWHAIAPAAAPVWAHEVAGGPTDSRWACAACLSLACAVTTVQASARLAALQLVVDEQLFWIGVEVAFVEQVAPAGGGVACASVVARSGRVAKPSAAADVVSVIRSLARELAQCAVFDAAAVGAPRAAPRVGAGACGDAARHRARAVVLARTVLASVARQWSNAIAVGKDETDVAVDPRARKGVERRPRRRVHHGKVHGNKGQPIKDVGKLW